MPSLSSITLSRTTATMHPIGKAPFRGDIVDSGSVLRAHPVDCPKVQDAYNTVPAAQSQLIDRLLFSGEQRTCKTQATFCALQSTGLCPELCPSFPLFTSDPSISALPSHKSAIMTTKIEGIVAWKLRSAPSWPRNGIRSFCRYQAQQLLS